MVKKVMPGTDVAVYGLGSDGLDGPQGRWMGEGWLKP